MYSEWEDVTSSGRALQVFGPATGRKVKATLFGVIVYKVVTCPTLLVIAVFDR